MKRYLLPFLLFCRSLSAMEDQKIAKDINELSGKWKEKRIFREDVRDVLKTLRVDSFFVGLAGGSILLKRDPSIHLIKSLFGRPLLIGGTSGVVLTTLGLRYFTVDKVDERFRKLGQQIIGSARIDESLLTADSLKLLSGMHNLSSE